MLVEKSEYTDLRRFDISLIIEHIGNLLIQKFIMQFSYLSI
jgi:hypothetical protein